MGKTPPPIRQCLNGWSAKAASCPPRLSQKSGGSGHSRDNDPNTRLRAHSIQDPIAFQRESSMQALIRTVGLGLCGALFAFAGPGCGSDDSSSGSGGSTSSGGPKASGGSGGSTSGGSGGSTSGGSGGSTSGGTGGGTAGSTSGGG